MDMDAFFELHSGLEREGPGEAADVDWAVEVAGIGPQARICDAGAGAGADIAALLRHGSVTAVELHDGFVAAMWERWADRDGVKIVQGDMAALQGPFDFIWSAGAIYFLGVTEGLRAWRGALAPGGAVAFSQVCWFVENPSPRSRTLWADYADMCDEAEVLARIAAAGYQVLATRHVSDAAWEAYFGPMEARIAALQPDARPALQAVLDETVEEIETWRAGRAEFGYLLSVVRPL